MLHPAGRTPAFGETDERNEVHRLFEHLGFRCEACLMEADWSKGALSTLRIYAMLNREWQGRRAAERGD